MITADSFPTPHLALRTNDPATLARVGSFADLQAAAAEDVRRRLFDADLPNRPFHEVLGELRAVFSALTQWRHQLAHAAPGRLGVGIAPDTAHYLLSHREGGESYDRLGYTGRLRCGATWDLDTRTFVGGEETPASAIITRYGCAALARFEVEAPNDTLQNLVRLPDGREFTGNRLVRGDTAGRIAEKLKARVAGRGCDTTQFETGGNPVYAVTAYPEDADIVHGVALFHLAGAFNPSLLRDERITAWQESRYLLYQGRQTKKGSDAVIRVFLVAFGAVLFGQPPVMEQDVDLRCMVLGQDAATEMPADEVLWS